ncbi:SusC/RagA family TonB-linked outer membrane protein [Arenibacter sp. BSSL-BM3]|uniref:SusC/RagA family TonB-linked outer membrane protein n=1 Tax=Arenibacter arenosicollis TaxID=2762274 RepID=A0ABR7QTM0_9FLAO|nr:SusC/RagA family TonB-linked outer membrane protein [Arenibacter arenosicollis]MBC8770542.1 SusC/RagA family TonB-linked outer membrane protein [Arenibacter arenosicollis]
MKNNLEYKGMLRICLLILCFLVPPPYFAHFPHGHCFTTSPNLLLPQQQQISGTVTDNYGPMSGVHVLIKGTKTGTFTNPQGEYFLLANNNDILVFSYLGYHSRELPVMGRTSMDVQMQSEVTELQEVEINAGYYSVKEKERTGSISRVTAKEIEPQPIVSPLEALQGRMAGVEVEQGVGITGLAPTIRIRGTNSLRNDGNYPLYIVDGIPLNSTPLQSGGSLTVSTGIDPLNTLNHANIESIEVLKDADATAIYGSRGANGVILISTKKGYDKQGETSLDLSLYSGISEVSNKVKLLNTEEYLAIRRKAIENDGFTPEDVYAPELTLWDQNRYTDWQETLFGGTASMTDVNMAVSEGNGYTSYRIGGSFRAQGSVFPGDFDYKRTTANINLNHRSKDNTFKLDFSANYGVDKNRIFNGSNFINYALTAPPNAPPIYKEDGSLNWENWVVDNPLAVLEQPQDIRANNLLANMALSYTIIQGLDLKVNLGYSKLDSEDMIRYYRERYNPERWDKIDLGTAQSATDRLSWIVEPQLMYQRHWGKLGMDALIGSTFQDNRNSYLNVSSTGYANKSLMGNLSAANEVRVLGDDNTEYRYGALFGRLGLNWAGKYFLNLTGRRDGSSRFGPDRRFSNFWALGGAWIFRENRGVQENVPFWSFGKLRGSYGTTGSDQIPDYGFLDAYEATDGVGGLFPTQLYNPDYSWEVNKKLEASLQLGFINDRINLELNWYRNRSSNQLVGFPLPFITGFGSVQANLPALVQNSGWEVQTETVNIRTKDFSWSTSINVTFPDNKLLEFDNIGQTSYDNQYKVGYPLNISMVYQYDGIDPETGLYRVVDINEDGRYNSEDRQVIINRGRKYYGGLGNHLQYKGLALQFLFEYIDQDNLRNVFGAPSPGRYGNGPVDFLNTWQEPGDNAHIQKLSQSSAARTAFSRAASSSYGMEDAAFLRLKNVSLSYNLPKAVLQQINISAMSVYVRAQNVFTITPYQGLDPQGGRSSVPPLRTITCGIQLNL